MFEPSWARRKISAPLSVAPPTCDQLTPRSDEAMTPMPA
jgi:hypothetical protein